MGKTVSVELGKFTVTMKVLDAKNSFGHERILVTPLEGSGQAWIDAKKVVKGGNDA